ncbi:MAG: VWA domain-containing protein [Armatimonadota bacterium]|nr:VWA domain-containing protein [Armatimonadota bacterium]MDR7452248.1 VWA domain-containing protein [Armatimonadota bacterium]MDR7466657.1 VWA domain-containing protein [Armatimonadota bacterium]MDR7492869.1 VWA domain-containing protein [Armatimonadota bacterium]MDR7498645.1 VWA domain-containing protein [Armatimonadota bacterium]
MATFIWPSMLWGLLLLPLLVLLYRRLLRRPPPHPLTYSTAELLRLAAVPSAWRRHLAAALFLLALFAVILTLARPTLPLPVPADRAAIILALDISGSMRSQDIAPNRLEAAKRAAEAFLEATPDRVRVGLVVFAGFSSLLSPPTTDHGRLAELIAGLGVARRTAIGEGLLEAVAALPGRARPGPDGALPPLPPAVPPGIVVLMSDGRSNTGIDPLEAARLAARQRVTVYTVGMGARSASDNWWSSGWTIGGPVDEETLEAVASITGGTYHHASSADELHGIYRRLARQVAWERRPTEVSATTAGAAALLLIGAGLLSWLLVPLRP